MSRRETHRRWTKTRGPGKRTVQEEARGMRGPNQEGSTMQPLVRLLDELKQQQDSGQRHAEVDEAEMHGILPIMLKTNEVQ